MAAIYCSQQHLTWTMQVPLAQIIQAYKSVLLHHGIAASEDTHYYRLLIALSLRPEGSWWAKLDAERQQAEASCPPAPGPHLDSEPVPQISCSPALQQEPPRSARQDWPTPYPVARPKTQQEACGGKTAVAGNPWPYGLREEAHGSQSINSPGAGRRPQLAPYPQSIRPAAHCKPLAQTPHRANAPQLNSRGECNLAARDLHGHDEQSSSAPHAAAAAEHTCRDQWQEVAEAFLASHAPQQAGSRNRTPPMAGRQQVPVQEHTPSASQPPTASYVISSRGLSPDSRRSPQQRPLPVEFRQSAALHHYRTTGDVRCYTQQVSCKAACVCLTLVHAECFELHR